MRKFVLIVFVMVLFAPGKPMRKRKTEQKRSKTYHILSLRWPQRTIVSFMKATVFI